MYILNLFTYFYIIYLYSYTPISISLSITPSIPAFSLEAASTLHSAKGGAEETGCSGLHDVIGLLRARAGVPGGLLRAERSGVYLYQSHVKIHQRGVQWKQGVAVYMTL